MPYLKEINEDFYTVTSKIDGTQYMINKQENEIFNLIINNIVRLMYESCHLDSILIFTDTGEHTCELQSRIALCIGEENAQSLWIQTFYNFYIKIFSSIKPLNYALVILF